MKEITEEDIQKNEAAFGAFMAFLEFYGLEKEFLFAENGNQYVCKKPLTSLSWSGCEVRVWFTPGIDIAFQFELIKIDPSIVTLEFYEVMNMINQGSNVGTLVLADDTLMVLRFYRPETEEFKPEAVFGMIAETCDFIREFVIKNYDIYFANHANQKEREVKMQESKPVTEKHDDFASFDEYFEEEYDDGRFSDSELADYYGYDSSMGVSRDQFLEDIW